MNEQGLTAKLLRFTKIEHTIFSIPLLFAGAWLGANNSLPELTTLGLIVLAGIGARVLGMSMNRVLDRQIDAANPRTAGRELPTGQLSVRSALIVAVAGLFTYLVACALLGPLILILSPIPAILLVGYSLLKRYTALCHFGIGITLGIAPLGAYVAVSSSLSFSPEIVVLALFAFCWISGFDIIYALQDIPFDRSHGVHSLPAKLGSSTAQVVSGICHATSLALSVYLLLLTNGGLLAFLALLVTAGAFVFAYLPRVPMQVRFFPTSAVAGIGGALVPLLGRF